MDECERDSETQLPINIDRHTNTDRYMYSQPCVPRPSFGKSHQHFTHSFFANIHVSKNDKSQTATREKLQKPFRMKKKSFRC